MIKMLLSGAIVGSALLASAPAQAVDITPGSSGLTFSAFDSTTQGAQIAFTSVAGTALTFAGVMRSAVYRNTAGTLDFYYQVARTGAGSIADQMIDAFTAASFQGYAVSGFVSAADPDGAGAFTAVNNPGGSTTTTGESPSGQVLQTNFGTNGLVGTETSATYIFRTNATAFTTGTFGVIDGSSFSGLSFAPAGAIPEPSVWGMMVLGLGAIGGAARYRRRKSVAAYI